MTDRRCPQCGSRDFTFQVTGRVSLSYIVEDGRVISNGGDLIETGSRATCKCDKCGRIWRSVNFPYRVDE